MRIKIGKFRFSYTSTLNGNHMTYLILNWPELTAWYRKNKTKPSCRINCKYLWRENANILKEL